MKNAKNSFSELNKKEKDIFTISVIKGLIMDTVRNANSGHTGGPMSSSDFAYILFKEYLHFICYVANITDKKNIMQDFYGFFNNGDALLKALSFAFITAISLVIAKKIFFRWKFVDKPNFRSNHKKPVDL